MNVLTVGRPSNIANLELNSFINQGIQIETATTLIEVEAVVRGHDIDTVVIGAGLEKDLRASIVKMLLEFEQTYSIYLCAKDTGPEGLVDSIDRIIKSES